MDIGHFHAQYSQRLSLNSISEVLIETKPKGYDYSHQSFGGKNTTWCIFCLFTSHLPVMKYNLRIRENKLV